MSDLKNLGQKGLEELMASLNEKPYRAHQLYRWIYKRGATSFDDMTDVSKGFREDDEGAFHHKPP